VSELLDPEAYRHLKAIAGRISSSRRGLDTIQPTALLHEAWEKLARNDRQYNSREHFMATAAQAMRQILVDRARARFTSKRGGGAMQRTTLSGLSGDGAQALDVLMLDEALGMLEALDPQAARIALLRTFSGMTVEETAETMGLSPRSVNRNWRFARAYLSDLMRKD
jgi:RNA polymerase sigma-70 factor (ECF subfamily)